VADDVRMTRQAAPAKARRAAKSGRNLAMGPQPVKQAGGREAAQPQAQVQVRAGLRAGVGVCAALLWVVGLGGCFSQNFAEGFYVEEANSGRWQAYNKWRLLSSDPMHFFRLRLVQFDEEVSGIVEIFTVSEYSTFSSQPLTVDRPRTDYFCTRLEYATSKDERLVLRFWDAQSRRWQLEAGYADDKLEGKLHRVTAQGEVLSLEVGAASGLMWEEDGWYAGDASLAQTYRPLVLSRERDGVEDGFLACVDHVRRQELVVRLPEAPPAGAKLALVMTRAERSVEGAGPAGVTFDELVTVTLDDIDLVNGQRSVLLRSLPQSSFVKGGVGVGTWIVYEDRPDAEGKRNGRWDTGEEPEAVWAVSQQRVVVFQDEGERQLLTARDINGVELGACAAQGDDGCLWDGPPEASGWTMYEYAASDERLADGNSVWLLRRLSGVAGGVVELRRVEPACQSCVTARDGQPRQGCAQQVCQPIFPVLFL
jgi:hypothetical protein